MGDSVFYSPYYLNVNVCHSERSEETAIFSKILYNKSIFKIYLYFININYKI